MGRSRARSFFAVTCLAAATLLPACNACAGEERLVIYVNADNERIRRAVTKLDAALQETGAAQRYRIRLRHVVANLWDAADIEAKMRAAIAMRPAAIMAGNGESAAIAKSLTREVPIIFGSPQNPMHFGLVTSFAHPGGNVTGFTLYVPVDQKRLEFLRLAVPGARKLGIVIDRWWMAEAGGREILAQARDRQGFQPELFVVETVAQLKQALATPRARAMDAWYVPYTVLPYDDPEALTDLFAAIRKPVVYPTTQLAERGGLVSYQPILSLEDSFRLWATMVGLVLDGVPPGEIPVERPKVFELAVNLDTARRLGISLPSSLVKRANRVIGAGPAQR
jgi:putative ABC transport system substrate-binding protein